MFYLGKLGFRMVSFASVIPSLDRKDWYSAFNLQDVYFSHHNILACKLFLKFTVDDNRCKYWVL